MQFKTISLLEQTVADRTVTGFAAVFGNVDDGNDILQPGAFTKTLKENAPRIRHLWQHDFNMPPIAVITSLSEVPKMALPPEVLQKFPDAKGGLMVTREYLNTPRGDEVLEGIRAGAIKEMSFAFDPIKVDYSQVDGKTIRNLREVKLYETSDVIWGMNAATVAAKGAMFDLYSMVMTGQEIGAILQAATWLQPGDLEQICQTIDTLMDLLMAAETILYSSANDDSDSADGQMSGKPPIGAKRTLITAARALIGTGMKVDGFKVGARNSADDQQRINSAIDALGQALTLLNELLNDESAEPPAEEESAMKALTDAQRALQHRMLLAKLNAHKLQGEK